MSAAFSPIIKVLALRLAEGIIGMIEASATRNPSMPWTRKASSITVSLRQRLRAAAGQRVPEDLAQQRQAAHSAVPSPEYYSHHANRYRHRC